MTTTDQQCDHCGTPRADMDLTQGICRENISGIPGAEGIHKGLWCSTRCYKSWRENILLADMGIPVDPPNHAPKIVVKSGSTA
jgi:hypothetical protein